MARVLIVDDDVGVRFALSQGLRAEGMHVVTVGDGPAVLREVFTGTFDVIVLDIGLPGLTGYQVLSRLRGAGVATPVLLISTDDQETAQAKGFDLGADGYLVKPLSLLVLAAHINAVLRRRDRLRPGHGPRQLRRGDLVLDQATRTATRGRATVELSPREYAVLHALLTRPGTVVSKPELRRLVWGGEDAVTPNAVEVYIGYVRRKLAHIGAQGVIRTVPRRGYQVVLPNAESTPRPGQRSTHRTVSQGGQIQASPTSDHT